MGALKQLCFVVSLGYFSLALFLQLTVLDGVFFHIIESAPYFNLNELVCGFLLVGFIALFAGTIFIINSENKKSAETAGHSEASKSRITMLITFLIVVNFFVNFFVFAVNTSGDHGTPEILSDGRYVMSYRTEIIKEIDETAYYRELSSYKSKTRLLFTSVMLLFTWGVFTQHIPKRQNSKA